MKFPPMKILRWMVLWALMLLAAGQPARAAVRVAVLCPSAAKLPLLVLSDIRLSQAKDVAVVERRAINRVLDEQKLALSGLMDANLAISTGRLLSADLFAIVEYSPNPTDPRGLVVFDAA